jgi:tetratricopeptide (TPR) repeat protein
MKFQSKSIVFLLSFLLIITSKVMSQNWDDSLKVIMQSNFSDSLKLQKLGFAINLLSNQNNPIANDFLSKQIELSSKKPSNEFLTAVYYSKSSLIYNSAKQADLFSMIDSCLYFANKSKYYIYLIRGNRLKSNFLISSHDYQSALEFSNNAYNYSKELEDQREIVKSLATLTQVHESLGNKKELIELTSEAIAIAEKNNYYDLLPNLYIKIGSAYFILKNYSQVANYYFKAKDLVEEKNVVNFVPKTYGAIGGYYVQMQNYDSALFYLEKADSAMNQYKNYLSAYSIYTNIADVYGKLNRRKEAKIYFEKSIAIAEKEKMFFVGRIYLNYANYLNEQKEDSLALIFVDKAIEYIKLKNDKEVLASAIRDKGLIYSSMGKFEKSIEYYRESFYVNDSINQIINQENLNELLAKYEDSKKEAAISKLNSQKQIQQLILEKQKAIIAGNQIEAKKKQSEIDLLNKQQEIQELLLAQQKEAIELEVMKSETITRKLKITEQEKQINEATLKQQILTKRLMLVGIFILLSFLGLGFNIYRINTKRKNDQEKFNLQNQLSELKLEALRSQMNPHFIFNALNSINRYILRSDRETASEYLVKFSKLMRLILENSKLITIPLKDELEALMLYVDMELLRFDNKFEFKLDIENSIEKESVNIPPLVLQPFIENAIWHGLNNKEDKGIISLCVKPKDKDTLIVIIEDNGIGRQKANELKMSDTQTNKSFGMQITSERIKALNKDKKNFKIIDLYDENNNAIGTRVEIELTTKAA